MAESGLRAPRRGQGGAPPAWQSFPQAERLGRASSFTYSFAGGSRRQSRLHNFSFPSVSWGRQRLLRCGKVEPPRNGSPSPDRRSATRRPSAVPNPEEGAVATGSGRDRGEEEVEERGEVRGGQEEDERLVRFRDSVMAEFQKAFDRIPVPSPLGAPPVEDKEPLGPSLAAAVAEASRPWNLRLRRAACNAPAVVVQNGSQKAQNRNGSPAPQENNSKAGKSSGQMPGLEGEPERKERRKFSSALSKEEIAADFLEMARSKPPRRPKKRPRNVQRQIEMLYPGFYLCEVTPDLYRIP